MKHTKGPWELTDNGEGDFWVHTPSDDLIAEDISTIDDARLIAAAPDMLEALEFAREYLLEIQHTPDVEVIDSVIRKAKGE